MNIVKRLLFVIIATLMYLLQGIFALFLFTPGIIIFGICTLIAYIVRGWPLDFEIYLTVVLLPIIILDKLKYHTKFFYNI